MAAGVAVNVRVEPELKAAAIAVAATEGLDLSKWVKSLIEERVTAHRAGATAVATPPSGIDLGVRAGAARNVTTRILSGACLHPIHLRERWGLRERCGGCGDDVPTGGRR